MKGIEHLFATQYLSRHKRHLNILTVTWYDAVDDVFKSFA